jgi:hypothetical protein
VEALIADKEDEDKRETLYPSSPFSEGINGWQNV